MAGSGHSANKVLIISSDGHATAKMKDYRRYLPAELRPEFDDFLVEYDQHGSGAFDAAALRHRMDSDAVDEWEEKALNPGRTAGHSDPTARLAVMKEQGIAAEVMFPDFGLPFELYSPFLARARGYVRTPEQVSGGNIAYNRWLADFCSIAPERFRGMATVGFDDVDKALREIRWAREIGLAGIVLPIFPEAAPIFDARYEPIWNLLEELDMPVNSHIALSAASDYIPAMPNVPHEAVWAPYFSAHLYFACHQILNHLIWGGVLERHPKLRVVFTEQGSGWVIGELGAMDHSWGGSYLRRDIREVVPKKPSEYFHRQCYLGSSTFSKAEADARHQIGVDRMMIGMDYPHHEGTWVESTADYLRATIGAAGVPVEDAEKMLGFTAAKFWEFDLDALQPVVDEIAPIWEELLTPPDEDLYPLGDVKRPLLTSF